MAPNSGSRRGPSGRLMLNNELEKKEKKVTKAVDARVAPV
jgi:hypothetical protein